MLKVLTLIDFTIGDNAGQTRGHGACEVDVRETIGSGPASLSRTQ